MKKALLTFMCIAAMMAVGTSLRAQEVTIELMPGTNWISLPDTDTLDFATAFGNFTPMQGDVIKSQMGSASYMNGRWRGNLPQFFYPGNGYLYKSKRNEPVSLTFQQLAPQVMVTTLEPTDIDRNSAVCGGNVASSNGDYIAVTLRGICWGTHTNPNFNDNYIEAGNGMGDFNVSMTELTLGVTYYVRAFAVTPKGTFYGDEVSFTTIDIHTYVDLGLPSGTLWATCNVGAETPEGYGDYYAWAETQPKDTYNWSTYQYCNGNSSTLTKYCDNSSTGYNGYTDTLTILQPEDDAATANWGPEWRTPTREEWQELYQNTFHRWTTQNGVYGRLFTATNGNTLFLPAAGCYNESVLYDLRSKGYYWSSSLGTSGPYYAWYFFFTSANGNMFGNRRYYGQSVRPVRTAY